MTKYDYPEFYSKFINRELFAYPVAHRGYLDGFQAQPENSIEMLQECLDNEFLFVEIDIQKTSDGVLVCSHDKTVDRMTNGSGLIEEMTLAEFKSLYLKEGNGKTDKVTSIHPYTLEEILVFAKGKLLLNIDKGWDFKEEYVALLEKLDCYETAIIKSEADYHVVAEFLQQVDSRFLYIQKIFEADMPFFDDILETVKPLIVEISFYSKNEEIIQDETILRMKEKTNVWLNALDVSKNAEINDRLSLTNPDAGWGYLINKQPNFIQTDFGIKYRAYLESR